MNGVVLLRMMVEAIRHAGPHAVALIVVTLAAFYLYTRSWIRVELVSLLLLLALVALFYLIPYGGAEKRFTDVEILEAFGHPALIAICSLMILGRGLTMTGAMEPAVRACETHRLPGIENTDARQLRDLAGGMLTSIGTSTNLLVLNIASDLGMPRMGLFDFTTQPWRREGAVDSES